MFTEWHKKYPGGFHKKPLLKKARKATRYYIIWKIWLARNSIIFNDEVASSRKVAAKS